MNFVIEVSKNGLLNSQGSNIINWKRLKMGLTNGGSWSEHSWISIVTSCDPTWVMPRYIWFKNRRLPVSRFLFSFSSPLFQFFHYSLQESVDLLELKTFLKVLRIDLHQKKKKKILKKSYAPSAYPMIHRLCGGYPPEMKSLSWFK